MMSLADVCVYRYLLTVHALFCFLVLFQHLLIGFRFNTSTTPIIRYVVYLCRGIPAVQLCVTLCRYLYSFNDSFKIKSSLHTYMDFFWSPMCTILLIWLLQLFMARTCNKLDRFVPPQMIQSPISAFKILLVLFLGVASGVMLSFVQYQFMLSFDVMTRVLFIFSGTASIFESMLYRLNNRGGVTLTSNVLMWYLGTFTYHTQIHLHLF